MSQPIVIQPDGGSDEAAIAAGAALVKSEQAEEVATVAEETAKEAAEVAVAAVEQAQGASGAAYDAQAAVEALRADMTAFMEEMRAGMTAPVVELEDEEEEKVETVKVPTKKPKDTPPTGEVQPKKRRHAWWGDLD